MVCFHVLLLTFLWALALFLAVLKSDSGVRRSYKNKNGTLGVSKLCRTAVVALKISVCISIHSGVFFNVVKGGGGVVMRRLMVRGFVEVYPRLFISYNVAF